MKRIAWDRSKKEMQARQGGSSALDYRDRLAAAGMLPQRRVAGDDAHRVMFGEVQVQEEDLQEALRNDELPTLQCLRNHRRLPNPPITRHQRRLLGDGSRADDFVGWLGCDIQRRAEARNLDRNRQNGHVPEESPELDVLEVQLETAEFDELGEFPEDDIGDGQLVIDHQLAFAAAELAVEQGDHDVCVERQHPSVLRWRKGRR